MSELTGGMFICPFLSLRNHHCLLLHEIHWQTVLLKTGGLPGI